MDFYCYAVTAPGIWPFAAQEMKALGAAHLNLPAVTGNGVDAPANPGGLDFRADLASLYRLNLRLRTPGRILVRLGNFFYARTFEELRQSAARLAWERFIQPGQPVEIRVTCHKSKLYHSGAVAERIGQAIEARLGQPSPEQKGAQRVMARLVDDRLTISIDSSGENLHKRGYRLETAKAPLRETLAAALPIACGWDGNAPLLDPFCGSGTIAIEATLLALNIAPGLNRRFAFMDWPNFDEAAWQAVRAEALAAQRNAAPPILASDRDEGAIRIALANAERAGVAEHIRFARQAVSAIEPPEEPGWVVTNPPYGARVSANKDLRNLYAQLGNVLRAQCPGWQVGILSSDRALLGQTGLTLDTGIRLVNGGLAVILARGRVE